MAMDIKKKFGIFAALLAVLLCAAPQSAQAAGKIRSFTVTTSRTSGALTVGDTIYVTVRMINMGWASTALDTTNTVPWFFKYTGTLTGNETYDELLQEFSKKPCLGLWLGGRLREAEPVEGYFPDPGVSDFLYSELGAHHYTDFMFSYVVQAGDIALPLTLSNAAGTGPLDDTGYYLKRGGVSVPWTLSNKNGDTCNFAHTDVVNDPDIDAADKAMWGANTAQGDRDKGDLDLIKADVRVQAIDFESTYADADAGVWRTVAQGSTTALPSSPALAIPGGVSTNTELFVWTEDAAVAEIVPGESVVETNTFTFDGKTCTVGTIRLNPAVDGDTSAPKFNIRARGAYDAGNPSDTKVYIAATTNAQAFASGTAITNFIFRTVRIGEPQDPSIYVTIDDKRSADVTFVPPTNNISVASLNVELTEPYTADIEIPLLVTVKGDASLAASDYIGISASSTGDNRAWRTTIVVRSGETKATGTDILWLYANHGDAVTKNSGLRIAVDTNQMAAASAAVYDVFKKGFEKMGDSLGATVKVSPSQPTLPGLAAGDLAVSIPSADANIDYPVTITLSDAYGLLSSPSNAYTVYWSNSGNDSSAYYTAITGITANTEGEITFNVKYPTSGDYNSVFYIVNQDGGRSPVYRAEVHVAAQKVVQATVLERRFPETGSYGDAVTAVSLSFGETGFTLPNGMSGDYGYMFFVPRNAASSNLVEVGEMNYESTTNCDWKAGIPVRVGDTEPVTVDMYFLDGSDKGTTLGYDIVMRTAETIDQGEVVAAWSSSGFQVIVTNVAPAVSMVKMGNDELFESGGNFGSITRGREREFSAETAEPSDLDYFSDEENGYSSKTASFETQWTFKIGTSTLFTTNIFGPPTTPFSYMLNAQGDYTAEVKMRDKDMVDARGRKWWGPVFTFTFTVDDKPSVVLTQPNGLTTFSELGGSGNTRIDVNLTQRPSEKIEVSLGVRYASAAATGVPPVTLQPSVLEFGGDSLNTTNSYFVLANVDGTDDTDPEYGGGLVITAAVTTATVNSGIGMAWKDYFRPGSIGVGIRNEDPVFMERYLTGIDTNATLNVPFNLKYGFSDCLADMTSEFTVSWIIEGEGGGSKTVDSWTKQSYTGEIPITFTTVGDGTKTVIVTIEDKDGGYVSASWDFKLNPAKLLYVIPQGPYLGGGVSDLSTRWVGRANPLGQGRVYGSNVGLISKVERFEQIYNYEASTPEAEALAIGYRVGDVEGTTVSGGVTVDSIGGSGVGYKYTDPLLDSFFYAWLYTASDGKSLTTALLKIVPQIGYSPVSAKAPLPEYNAEATAYPNTYLEAVFSKELRAADNLGDINSDGIPDYYAVAVGWNGGTFLEAAGVSTEEGGDVTTRLDAYNEDADYLPSGTFIDGVPSTADGWTATSVKFTADYEIRGFHPGLNHRRENDGKNRNVRGEWISVPEFSEAETNAVAFWNLGPTNTLAWFKANAPTGETEYAAAYTAWTNDFMTALMKSDSWIPENRTDPTMWDTDDDTLPDGYEYYFWYAAAVGRMDGANWVQMTGERFTLNNIGQGETITPKEIMDAFDPTVKAEGEINIRDTDNDGLYDLEEYAMGTNPVHWDSDKDGMSDLWEVMRGMNPLAAPPDAELNLDGDFMASYETDPTYAILTMEDGSAYALPFNGTGVIDESVYDNESSNGIAGGTNVAVAAVIANASNVTSIAVFHYGRDDAICVPAGAQRIRGAYFSGAAKPLDAAQNDLSGKTVKSLALERPLRLVHRQVYNQFGFDPRTGWFKDEGYVAGRWKPVAAHEFSEAGRAENTERYTCRDEYLVLKYRYELGIRSASKDIGKIAAKELTIAGVFSAGTTNPRPPFTDAGFAVSGAGDGALPIPTYSSTNHGADTDEDGVPDGWELYVGSDPNSGDKDGWGEVKVTDGDQLELVAEYAGTDSCNAYEGAKNANGDATIYAHHPGKASGWYNKFFPTDPYDNDTDGDGISDHSEGATWRDLFRLWQSANLENYVATARDGWSHEFTFIYGDPSDDGSRCIRGGGLNPCTIDTDFDLLPDGWERQFAGIVFKDGRPWESGDSTYGTGGTVPSDVIDVINRNDHVVSNSTPGVYITAGMDGTLGPESTDMNAGDAVTSYSQTDPRTGTRRNFDFDNDGLQNFQEYLVQTLRHLRYDDSETPLMGSYLPDGQAGTRKYIGFLPMQMWDGEAFYREARAKGFTGSSAMQETGFLFEDLGYFVRPPRAWDSMAVRTDGVRFGSYGESGYRVLLTPTYLSKDAVRIPATLYASTDPRLWDSDSDGMDDYYELFHGLNPLLGGVDVVSWAYPTYVSSDGTLYDISAKNNAWTGWTETNLVYDAMMYPWAMGVAEADADGDGLRNYEEALLVNMPNPQNYHTDPTPLWMTDPSSPSSFTAQYYGRDPYLKAAGKRPELSKYFWFEFVGADPGAVEDFMFSFEENEGYDTDHDWIPDEQELTHAVEGISDPLDAVKPDRRQAMYFPGENSAVVSHPGRLQRRIGDNYAMLRSFTVEAWVRPEDVARDQTILTRVCDYPASTMVNSGRRLRANFRLGVDSSGCVYGQYDSSDAVQSASQSGFGTTTVVGLKLKADKWTHVALSYGGKDLILYMDGREVARASSTLVPANGIAVTLQSVVVDTGFGEDGYTNYPSALLIGADAVGTGAVVVGEQSSWTNYAAFYKGWVDEVRVWDGARTQVQILADYVKRYSLSDISSLRDAVYNSWAKGATRNANDGNPNLPAELVLHYNFQQLPSSESADGLRWIEPSGFTQRVFDNVRINRRPVDISCGWWSAVPIASTVYPNRAVVPWLRNSCASLPALDGSTADSRYWSSLLAGMTLPTEAGVSEFSFSRTANPYPYWNYMSESYFRKWALSLLRTSVDSTYSAAAANLYRRCTFDEQTAFVRGSDLLPLGGAFVKRCVDFWDGNGPTDAWIASGDDLDNDGLPDWWERFAAANYGADADDLTVATVVQYKYGNGQPTPMTAREAYLRDLAHGLLSDGKYHPEYANTADENGDGIPDWWQKMYGVFDYYPYEDPDNDGLSIYQEWWLSDGGEAEGFGSANGFPKLDVTRARTFLADGQAVPDYFLGVSSDSGTNKWDDVYFGFMATDHDFIENWWEMQYANGYSNASVYDPLDDWDENGWSNYAEARYQMWRNLFSADLIDGWNIDGTYHVDYFPEPALAVRSTYYGVQDLTSNTPHPQIPTVVTATRKSETTGRIDAKYVAVSSDVNSTDDGNSVNQYLGPYRAGAVMRGFLSPGCVVPATVLFYKANVGDADYKYWKLVWQTSVGGPNWWSEGSRPVTNHYSGALAEYTEFIQSYPQAQLEQANLNWKSVATVVSDPQNRMGTITHSGTGETLGSIDLHSGEYVFDLEKLAEVDSEAAQLYSCVFMVAYASKIGNEWPQTIYYSNTKELDVSVEAEQRGVGHVMEGENTITSLIDLDRNGDYTPGEPFGVLLGVDVGWHKVPEQVVELKDTSHVVPRFDLLTLTDDRTVIKGVAGMVAYTGRTLNDMTNGVSAKTVRINIARKAINGAPAPRRVLLSKEYVLPDEGKNSHARTFIHEGDILKRGVYDMDWKWLVSDAARLGFDDVQSVTYELCQSVDLPGGLATNVVLATFVNKYNAARAVPSADSPRDGGTVFSVSPTFKWTCSDDTMTAFDLQVLDTAGSVVYDSGVQLLPGRIDGAYTFTPRLYADAPVATNGAPVFADGSNYFWRVAMLNAKYNTADGADDSIWSAKRSFKMDTAHKVLPSGYGSAEAVVRYFGPCGRKAMANDVTGASGGVQDIKSGSGLIVVEAFENADFHGRPMAQIRLSDYADLYSTTNTTTVNATFRGLDPGTLYFRAYIDQNNNGRRDSWEPWGYANHVDTHWRSVNGAREDWEEWGNSSHFDGYGKVVSEAIYDPLGVVVVDGPYARVPKFVIYIEDCDVNRNNVPDCLEAFSVVSAGASGDTSPDIVWPDETSGTDGTDGADADGDGIPDEDESAYGTDPRNYDTDGDGMPDGYEVENGLDPLINDSALYGEGDVMAFAAIDATVLTVTNMTYGGAVAKYVLPADVQAIPRVGDDVAVSGYADKLCATYVYSVMGETNDVATALVGLGTNVTLTASNGVLRITRVARNQPVVLVHAQVYGYYGFDPLTANSTAYAAAKEVNTKPFTALDKYLVFRYFEALGLAVSNTWRTLSLPADTSDLDVDGIPDGWELYVMFGTNGVTSTLEEARISPYNWEDARSEAPAGGLTVLEKWNDGNPAYDPWKKNSISGGGGAAGWGIDDADMIEYRLDNFFGDEDNDQLPNFTEYLIGKGFKSLAGKDLEKISSTNMNSYGMAGNMTDYFRRVKNLYLGEMFTDHDFMEDWWEDFFKPDMLSRGLYDPWSDPDDDGWSNYAECRAGTDPTLQNTSSIAIGNEGAVIVRNYPVPTIHANLVMAPGEGMLTGQIVLQAYSETSKASGLPDAVWTVTAGSDVSGAASASTMKTRYLGLNPNSVFERTLDPGSITPGTVSMDFLDADYIAYNAWVPTYGRLADAEWQEGFVWDDGKGNLIAKSTYTDDTYDIGTIDYVTGRMAVDFTRLPETLNIVEDAAGVTNGTYTLIHLDTSHVRVTWDAKTAGGNSRTTLHLVESDEVDSQNRNNLGHVREGRNTFVVFLDENNTGSWDPGEPYGVVTDVNVGWSDAEFTLELSKTTPTMARFELAHALGDWDSGYDSVNGATDRGNVDMPNGYGPNEAALYPGSNTVFNGSSLTRVRIVRNWINRAARSAGGTRNYGGVVFDRKLDLSVHSALTEADLLADGLFDLDWGTLNMAYAQRTTPSLNMTNVTYRVVIGDGDAGEYEELGNNLPVLFSNRFEQRRTATVPDPKQAQLVYPARPTFRWSHTNSIAKAYPAFRLRIYSDAGRTSIVYDSGVQRSPARSTDGMYEWTAPVYAGMATSNGRVFSTTNNYWWAVSMLDAKFTEFEYSGTDFAASEVATPFRLGTGGSVQDKYGTINVSVKYFGALAESLSTSPTARANLIHVQAFTTPDFSGAPVSEAYVSDKGSVYSDGSRQTNAVLRGVALGTYYVRAYIDTDGNGAKSDWESWGYNCHVGDSKAAYVWAPKPVVINYDAPASDATVFIEDADTDNDGFPDSWEMHRNKNLSGQGPISGNTFFATVNPYLYSSLDAYVEVAANLAIDVDNVYERYGRLLRSVALTAAASDGEFETTVVYIKNFSLEEGLELEVKNDIGTTGALSDFIVFAKEVYVDVVLMYSATPDFADARETTVDTIEIKANGEKSATIDKSKIDEARAGMPAAGFFKVSIRKR